MKLLPLTIIFSLLFSSCFPADEIQKPISPPTPTIYVTPALTTTPNVEVLPSETATLTFDTAEVWQNLQKSWVEKGYHHNGVVYEETTQVTGKTKTTEVTAKCVRYDHTVLCTQDTLAASRLEVLTYVDKSVKEAGQILMADPNVPNSEKMAGRLGALVHAMNLEIDVSKNDWYETFLVYLNDHPNEMYDVYVHKPNNKGEVEYINLGQVDPTTKVKIVRLNDLLNNDKTGDRNYNVSTSQT
jgi:hypothetical protein